MQHAGPQGAHGTSETRAPARTRAPCGFHRSSGPRTWTVGGSGASARRLRDHGTSRRPMASGASTPTVSSRFRALVRTVRTRAGASRRPAFLRAGPDPRRAARRARRGRAGTRRGVLGPRARRPVRGVRDARPRGDAAARDRGRRRGRPQPGLPRRGTRRPRAGRAGRGPRPDRGPGDAPPGPHGPRRTLDGAAPPRRGDGPRGVHRRPGHLRGDRPCLPPGGPVPRRATPSWSRSPTTSTAAPSGPWWTRKPTRADRPSWRTRRITWPCWTPWPRGTRQ